METEKVISSVKRYFDTLEDVTLVIAFGSFLEGRITPESDLDLGIMFKKRPELSLRSDIMYEVSKISGLDTDLVVLNSASPIIKFQILKKGKVIKDCDCRMYNDFYARTIKEYDDLKRIRREQEKNILRGRIYA